MIDPTLNYAISWQSTEPFGPIFPFLVRMKESQAKRIEAILLRHEALGHIIEPAVEEAGDLLSAGGFMKILKDLPGFEKDWMP